MFDQSKMFEDSADMIATIAGKRPGVAETMISWLQYCMESAPEYTDIWDRLALLDYEADFDGLTAWVAGVLKDEPPTDDVKCLRFGLYNPDLDGGPSLQFYISGVRHFNPSDPHADWPSGSPDYWPQNAYAQSTILPAIYQQVNMTIEDAESYLGEAFLGHGYVAAIVAQWCDGPLATSLTGQGKTRAVQIGHDSGDSYFIHLPNEVNA